MASNLLNFSRYPNIDILKIIDDLEFVRNCAIESPQAELIFDKIDSCISALTKANNNDIRLSEHFKLSEFLFSTTALKFGIRLNPSPTIINNLKHLCDFVLEPARKKLCEPIIISSGYRTPKLNSLVGGAANSFHLRGCAADLQCSDLPKLYSILKKLPCKELISHVPNYIHVAINPLY